MERKDYEEIKHLAQLNSVERNMVHRIINARKTFIRNGHICATCPSAIWSALTEIKHLHERIQEEWEQRIADEDSARQVQEYKEQKAPLFERVEKVIDENSSKEQKAPLHEVFDKMAKKKKSDG